VKSGDPQLRHPAAGSRESGGKLNATLVDMRFVKPLDEALILQLAETRRAGDAGRERHHGRRRQRRERVLMAHRKAVPVLNIGLPDLYSAGNSGRSADLGLDAAGIEAKIRTWLA
jgi:1-deoxy-D-xylulose-5-phosphate synthase